MTILRNVRTVLLAGCTVAVLAGGPALAAAPAPDWAGHWTGEVRFRGDTWPVELELRQGDDGPGAVLDLPELVYAWEPIPVEVADGRPVVELPFGLGPFRLEARGGETLAGRRALGDDELELTLHRSAPPGWRFEPISISSPPATLLGDLVLPPGPGPHPAVVLLHGSAHGGREGWNYCSWAVPFLRRGYAVLLFDKRGTGESTGPWMERSFADLDELAADAVAAVDLLAARPEIDAGRIGLSGGSQAGWVALLAAERSERVAFLALRSAPVVSPAEQELQSVAHRMRSGGHDEAAVQHAIAHTRLYFYAVATGQGWEELVASTARVAAQPWAEIVFRPETPDDLTWWRGNHALDPDPLFAALRIPLLALYGGADPIVPPLDNAPRLRALLAEQGADATILTFPGADHGLELPMGRDATGAWRFPRKAPGALRALDEFLSSLPIHAAPQGVVRHLSPLREERDAPAPSAFCDGA